jgi:ribosomal protein L14
MGLLLGAVIKCPGNRRTKNLYIMSVKEIKGWLKRLRAAAGGDMAMATVKRANQS